PLLVPGNPHSRPVPIRETADISLDVVRGHVQLAVAGQVNSIPLIKNDGGGFRPGARDDHHRAWDGPGQLPLLLYGAPLQHLHSNDGHRQPLLWAAATDSIASIIFA